MKTWSNSLFKNWDIYFYALFDDFMIMKKIPEVIEYDNFCLIKNIKIYDIRSVHWFDSRS